MYVRIYEDSSWRTVSHGGVEDPVYEFYTDGAQHLDLSIAAFHGTRVKSNFAVVKRITSPLRKLTYITSPLCKLTYITSPLCRLTYITSALCRLT